MNSKALVSTVLIFSLASAGFAFASDRNQRGDGVRYEQMQRGNRGNHGDRGYHGDRGDDRRQDERGAGPDHQFYRGERLPMQYRSHQYVVNDWRSHRLSAPPRGYHWVQTGGDYVLVAIATGVILQLLLNH
ncbi:nickel/cobalt homeostasis protein RcnB precursor [mine drainage metagenome]|uniref:Nickel/cobalt homeostasis protein RcnB n=1 Tax=mine drainage metagenome TaxID=410659 RepID=A0A1J5P4V7_9ZZZZ